MSRRYYLRRKTIQTDKLSYPHDIDGNLRFRAELLASAEDDETLQEQLKEYFRRNIIEWVNLCCWTKDPRRKPSILPFIAYDEFQPATILRIQQAVREQFDLGIDKTRDMGVSWMVLYVFMHEWLFEEGSDFRVGSRKEEFVDKPGDIDTLFEKVRFNIEKQPIWLMPPGFEWGKHSSYMKLIRPDNGNAIIGESANLHFGSGGRRKAIMLDEYSKWDDSIAEASWTATADVTKCRIPVSTPFGSANKFAQLMKGTKEKIERLSLHWTLHPLKARDAYYYDVEKKKIPVPIGHGFNLWRRGKKIRSPWYDAECERRKDQDVAQELDIDYLKSGNPFFDLTALSHQVAWEETTRKFPTDPIPHGHFVRVNLVKVRSSVELRDNPNGYCKIFELPKAGYEYVLGADSAEGLAKGDEAFAVVREKISRNVVATINGIIPPEVFAERTYLLEKFYNSALNVSENNNHGYSTCHILEEMGSNLYYTVSKTGKDKKRGYTTTTVTRPLFLDGMDEDIRTNACEFRDPDIIAQCETFVNHKSTGKPQADGDFLDDGIIATAIAGQVIRERPFKGNQEPRKTKKKQLTHDIIRRRKNAGFRFKKKKVAVA